MLLRPGVTALGSRCGDDLPKRELPSGQARVLGLLTSVIAKVTAYSSTLPCPPPPVPRLDINADFEHVLFAVIWPIQATGQGPWAQG